MITVDNTALSAIGDQMKKTAIILSAIWAMIGFIQPVEAAITTVTFPNTVASSYLGTGDIAVGYGGIVFGQNGSLGDANLFMVGQQSGATPNVISSQVAVSGLANISVNLPALVQAATIRFAVFGSSFSDVFFNISNGSSYTLSVQGTGYTASNVFNVSGVTPFDRIDITSVSDVLSIAEVSYETMSAVPEPATWAMMILGMGMLGAAMRSQRKLTKVRFAF